MMSARLPVCMLLLAVASMGCEATPTRGSAQKTTAAPTASVVPMTPEARTAPKPTATAASSATPSSKRLLEVVLVDDEVDLFAPEDGQVLPDGLSVVIENVPRGPGKEEPRHFLRVPRGDAKDVQAALAPHREWWESMLKKLPTGRRFAFQRFYVRSDVGGYQHVAWRSYVLHTEAVVDQTAAAEAVVKESTPESGLGLSVIVKLTPEAGKRFHERTRANVKRRMAILVDGEVMNAPAIQEAIEGGSLRIAMDASSVNEQRQQAKRLAAALNGTK